MSLITIQNITVGYGSKILTEDLSFEVESGDYICIIGDNGSGKSTFVRTLLGLQHPVRGRIIFGEGLKHNETGYLPQQTVVQKDFPATVGEIVLSGCQGSKGLRPFYNAKEKNLARKNMERLNIYGFAKKSYRKLSGGQQQRVLLARALCASEKLLVLDEPVAGLDPQATEDMYGIIKGLNDEGMTVIMISHDIKDSLKYATHVLHMKPKAEYMTIDEYRRGEANG